MSMTIGPHLLVKVKVEVSTKSEHENAIHVTEQFEFSCYRAHTEQSRLSDIEDILGAFRHLEYRLQTLPLPEKKGE